jgi:transcriptional regulator with XRE-family HTH domain
MDNRSEVRAFLSSRRAKVSPEQAGIPAYGSRRVAGLRRGEVAALAGVSVEYYTRLERGHLAGVSESVLEALARALRLDDTETAHLHHRARAAGPQPARARARRDKVPEIRPAIRHLLTTSTWPASSVSCRCAATASAPGGPPRTSSCTGTARSASATRPSASWSRPTKRSTCPATRR